MILGLDFLKKTGKFHKSYNILLQDNLLIKANLLLPHSGLTNFVNCTKDFENIDNVFNAYKLQLDEKWKNDKIKPKFDEF